MYPNPYRIRGLPRTLSAIPKDFLTGLQGKKSPKMIPRRYSFPALSVIPTETAERSVPMPRMSNKRRLEWSFFLRQVKVGNTTCDRITYNDLCRGCTHSCKQRLKALSKRKTAATTITGQNGRNTAAYRPSRAISTRFYAGSASL